MTTKWQVPASNKSVERQRRRPAKRVVIASVTHQKRSNYKEMAVLYYEADEAGCPAVLEKNANTRRALLVYNHTGMGASLKE